MAWILSAALIYLGALCAVAWYSLRPFRTPLFMSPGALGAPQEALALPSTDGVLLAAWWVPSDRSSTVAILAHGYMMNRSELAPVSFWLWQHGISSLSIDFRAHGRTRGGVSTVGWREADDIEAAVAEARRRVPDARIVIIGSSMGSAAAAFAVARGAPCDALVLDSCYSSLLQASYGWWRFLGGRVLSWVLGPAIFLAVPFARLNPFKVDVSRALAAIRCPVLMLHGRCDDLALPREAERNLAALAGQAEMVWFDDCGHSEFRWVQPQRYYSALESFLLGHGRLRGETAHERAMKLSD